MTDLRDLADEALATPAEAKTRQRGKKKSGGKKTPPTAKGKSQRRPNDRTQ